MMGRVLYGAVFCVVLPVLLVAWAWSMEGRVGLPIVQSTAAGLALASGGLVLIGSGMSALWFRGGGLPMNAFPPARLVTSGAYGIVPHPIYVGFSLVCVGVSMCAGSRAGFWVVSPLVMLGCAALVWGYERHDLVKRFGGMARARLSLPRDGDGAASWWDVASVQVLVLLPWAVLYEVVGHIQPRDVIGAHFSFERGWPVWVWTEAVYAGVYPFVILAPLAARTSGVLRRFCVAGWVGTAIGMLGFVAIPLVAVPREFAGDGWLAWLLRMERGDGVGGYAAFPSFHVFWAMLAAWVYARRWKRWAGAAWLCAAAIAASCITTGMHAVVDVVGRAGLFAIAFHAGAVWQQILRGVERVANSWREWRFGPVRVINHGAYAGLGAMVGVAGASMLAGSESVGWIVLIAGCGLIGAGLWGQALVGSPTLLRPFGYYGSVLGAGAGLAAAAVGGADVRVLAGALTVMAPWIQAAGRLRCLVQGCCHGAPCGDGAEGGIRYIRDQSRVCRIAHLKGVAVHPTPLYSILGNIVIGVVLARLWRVGAEPMMVAGLYLVLAGLSRFVEESYRGEPQTPMKWGLRLYQWFAVMSMGAGAVVMGVAWGGTTPATEWNWSAVGAGAAMGLVYWFAMGVDFPASNRRFSRLA